jgi:hypothetical protein
MEETNIHALSGILTRDPNNRAVADLRLRPHFIGDFTVISGVKKNSIALKSAQHLFTVIYEGQTDE